MNPVVLDIIVNGLLQAAILSIDLIAGFAFFWCGQWMYQKWFRHMDLNLELFVRDNYAIAIALVGYYLGTVIALGSVLEKSFTTWQDWILTLVIYGLAIVLLMLVGAWIGDRLILRCFDCAREIQEEQNLGAAFTEAGIHVANGLILNTALGGEGGSWLVGIACWAIGIGVLVLVSTLYPRVASYNVFREIQNRNNPAAGIALAGLLIATGNIVRAAFTPEFESWGTSFAQYGLTLGICLIALAIVRWLADLILVPGANISQEIVHQEIPNVGVGVIEAFSYISASFLIVWTA